MAGGPLVVIPCCMDILAIWADGLSGEVFSCVRPVFWRLWTGEYIEAGFGSVFFSVGRQAIVIVCRNSRSMELKMLALFIF